MSIRFSEVVMSDQSGSTSPFLLDGHPDEEDLRQNIHVLHEVALFGGTIQVSVQQYCYLTSSNGEEADDNHLALIHAYDELAELCNSLKPTYSVGTFTDRDDVIHGEYFSFMLEVESPC